jgi:hypothetical protein
MTRYFYTDPLAAAWMAKHFGMRFYCESGTLIMSAVLEADRIKVFIPNTLDDNKGSLEIEPPSPLNIDPGSLHLLEPLDGDKDEDGFRFENGAWVRLEMNGTKRVHFTNESHTARRTGIAFHWPEAKAV